MFPGERLLDPGDLTGPAEAVGTVLGPDRHRRAGVSARLAGALKSDNGVAPATRMPDLCRVTDDYRILNRANWDERAPAHAASPDYARATGSAPTRAS